MAKPRPARQDAVNRPSSGSKHDPGAYIGHEPEFEAETIPGGIGPRDQRVSALDTQSTGAGALKRRETERDATPEGHRVGTPVDGERRRSDEAR